jgi:hypothetical protein
MANFTIETSREVDTPPDLVWSVISDAGAYHTLVDTLAHTEIIAGDGHGMIRHCVDTNGREWNETCTLWDEDKTFRMTVDIASYPASFRAIFEAVEATWSVTPSATGTLISMRFTGKTKLGPLGRLAVAAMGRDTVLNSIMDGYETQIANQLNRDPEQTLPNEDV